MGSSPIGPNMAQQFSSVFKPISINDQAMGQTRRGLSLWVSQGPRGHEAVGTNFQEIHQVGSTSSGAIFGDLLVPCSNPPSSGYQLNWPVFGNKLSSNNAEELTSTLLPVNDVKGAAAHTVGVPSLYSTQQQSHQTTSTNMSATALLQKAAEIGATSTAPLFLGNFGLKSSTGRVQDGNKFCGLYGPNPENNVDDSGNDISTLNQMQMYPAKRQKIQSEDSTGGQTRDFLGVGVQAICHPSSINGWI